MPDQLGNRPDTGSQIGEGEHLGLVKDQDALGQVVELPAFGRLAGIKGFKEFVTLLAGIFLKEKITPVKIASTILCLVGAYIAMQPSFDSNPFPLLAALLAAVVSGMAYTMLSYCKNFTHPSAIIFHFSALSTVCAGLMMLPNLVIPSPKVFVMLLLIGVFAAGGQFFLTYAYQQAPASEVSIYQYSGVVFTAVFSYAFLGETLSKSSIIGGIVILGAIFWVFENTRKEKNT